MTKNGFLFIFILALGFSAHAQITSTFDTNADGWTCSDNNHSTPLTLNYNSTGGNPGGYISAGTTSLQPYFFTSPSKFGGNIQYFCYGQNLTFDMQLNYAPTTHGAAGDIQISVQSGSKIVLNLPSFPAQAPAWSTHTIRLDETAGWRLGGTTGPLATKADMMQHLSGVLGAYEFRFNINYTNTGSPSGAIDNVVLNQRTILPSPSISSISLTSGNPGTSVTISGSNFDPAVANNAVYFGGVAGIITSASATSLVVTVPNGAQYGQLTVTNKTTGLSKLSAQPYTPTFNDGGRIIPASFDPKFDITITGGYGGASIADMDGDGWNDLVVASGDNSGIGVYRNLGLGGKLTASSFAARVNFLTGVSGTNGSGLSTTDLDGDGKLDMVTSGWVGGPGGGVFVTFRNTSTPGNLSFESVERWNGRSDESPVYNAVDIDGDGLPELVSGEGSGGAGQNVWIIQNMSSPGDIQFGFPLFYFPDTLDDAPSGATIRDLNNDGKPEFILKRQFNGAFTVFTNTSTPGTISFGTNFSITASLYGQINVADFNLDGKIDLAWKSGFSNDDVHIRLNSDTDGILTDTDFATEVILPSDLFYYGAMSIADINGDGKPDIVGTDGDVGVFENVFSGGTFDASAFVPAYQYPGVGNSSTFPAVPGDLNGDYKPDLFLATANNTISIFENINVHTPVISLSTVSPLMGAVGSTVTVTGDYFSTTPSENIVRFGHVTTTATTSTKTQLTVTVPAGASMAAVSVTKNQLTATYHLPFIPTFSPGVTFDNTHFAPPVNFTLTGAAYDLDVGDINNDGKPDVVADGQLFNAYAFRNTHTTGGITNASLLADDTTSNGYYSHLIDLDGDGNIELLSGGGPCRNVGVGSEIKFETAIYISPASNYYNGFADYNQDGKTDFVGIYNGTSITLHENRTTIGPFIPINAAIPTFNDARYYTKPAPGGSVVAGDFDKDGLVDFASTNPSTDNVTVWKNNGAYGISTTQFSALPDIAVGVNPTRIYTGDFDRDGKIDLMLVHGTGTTNTRISILQNQSTVGNISFAAPINLVNPSALTVAHVADLDGDGKPEIITTSESGNRFSIFKNIHNSGALSTASFAAPFNTTVTAPRGITAGDLNLDGKPEIILTRATGLLVVYQNLIAKPTITSFLPISGPVGTQVVITGTNFSTTTTNNTVLFNGTTAYVLSSSATSITAFVPPGTTTGPISVTVSSITATSASNFTIVPFACPPGTRQGGDLDATFNPLVQSPASFTAVELQSTGKSIVATPSAIINGNSYDGLLRFNPDGSLDNSFASSLSYYPNDRQLKVLPNDKILVVEVATVSYIKRLNVDGSTDNMFNSPGYYASTVFSLGYQADNKVLLSIYDDTAAGIFLYRLNADGTFDNSFTPVSDFNANVILQQADGKILAAGPSGVIRIEDSGSTDPTFAALNSLDGDITEMVIQSNGKIVLVGSFTKIDGLPARNIARLNSDGSIDTSFLTGNGFSLFAGSLPSSIKLLGGDRMLVAGEFLNYNDEVRTRLLMLNADGSLYCSFNPQIGADAPLVDAAVQPDGKILIVGSFSNYDGTARNAFARVNGITASCVPASERAALVALYNSTNGASWTNKSNWLSADENSWLGVVVTGCRVTNLSLTNNNLSGPLPTEMGDLTQLQTLQLWSNNLTGTIPNSIGNLSNLIELDLNNNKLTGAIPSAVGTITTLQKIRLDRNQLTGALPNSIFNLVNLTSLELGDNQLSGSLPSTISNLTNLQALGLSSNQFTGTLPTQIGNLINLTRLQLSVNQFTGNLPASIGNLVNLTAFSVFNNQLTGTVPSSLSNLVNLNGLGLSVNQFTGVVPAGIGLIPNLNDVSLRDNDFTSIPTFVSTFFTDLLVYGNKLNFGHLEPNISKGGFVYAPQDNLPGGVASACVGTTLTINFSTPGTANSYQWYKNGVLITGVTSANFVKANVTAADAGNYTVQVSNSIVTGLILLSDNFVVTINSIPNSPAANPVSVCPAGTATLTATGGTTGQYRWYNVASGGTAIAGQTNSTFATPGISVVTTFYVSVLIGTCESARTAVVVTPIASACAPPTIASTSISITIGNNKTLDLKTLITTPSGTIDINSITVTVPPPSGAIATINGGVLTLDYKGIVFAGKEKITIRACDTNGNCTTQQIEIEVVGEIVVYNAVSPNGDGKNEFLVLQFIESISPKNQVSIYNRWGDEVFAIADYDNKTRVFAGLTTSGNKLPSGTYFYKILLADAGKTLTGFISLK